MSELNLKILIIEDEIKTAETLKKGLEENNFFVDIVFDGDSGLKLATKNKYDLIISDVMIPGINGFEFCRTIRELSINTPMIMLTALSMTSDKIAGFEAGADQYMVKPFEFEELLARVKSVVKRVRS
jgi:two-component system copper resistance phosphate regulon response regulator CusR